MQVTPHQNGWIRQSRHGGRATRLRNSSAGAGSANPGSTVTDHTSTATYDADFTRISSKAARSDSADYGKVARAAPAERIPRWAISAIYRYGAPGSEPPIGKHVDTFV